MVVSGTLSDVSLLDIEVLFLNGEENLGDGDEHDDVDVEGPLPRELEHHDDCGH